MVLALVALALVALSQIRRRGEGGRGLAIAALVISGAWVLLIGAFVAVALVAAVVQDGAGASGDVFEIGVGECFDEPSGEVAMRITAVPCTEPHFAETFAEFDVAGDTLPR